MEKNNMYFCKDCLNIRDEKRKWIVENEQFDLNSDQSLACCQMNRFRIERDEFDGIVLACIHYIEGRTPLELAAERYKENENK